MFASLVIPALAVAGKAQGQSALLPAFWLGVLGYAAGIAVSAWLDLPTGASIVWFLALAVYLHVIYPIKSGHIKKRVVGKNLLPD